ncbi:hypothetical protein [Agromyces sp. Marseille-P2726]|uniref:hypothetical protein n=1 Tax=Agromyces sp. Marseille-P2726 TaxID=2709132 RepID=UPI001570A930|nr:hypothetical protein [Agromyces sp. Marseille-P2726]
MEAPASTTLVVVGDESTSAIHALEGYANVRALAFDGIPDDEVARWSATADAPYFVHDHDPLAHVAAAWVEFFDDQSTYGVLELEIDRAVEAAERHEITVPDYYVVLHPEDLRPTWQHWWLGVLASAAPTRVIPWPDADDSLARLLRHLPTGRAWPEMESWLPGVVGAVPDRVGLPGS